MKIEWQYGEREYRWYNQREKRWVSENRLARWFWCIDGYGRNKEVVCYKIPGNVGAYGGDIVFVKWKEYDFDSEFNIVPGSERWLEMWDSLFLKESHTVSNTDSCHYEIKGNIFEHPHLLRRHLQNAFTDGVAECVGFPRFNGDRESYYAYIQSHAWKRRKAEIIKRDKCACAICGAKYVPLHIHHLTYQHFEHERDSELITLCADCHKRIHDESDLFYLRVAKLPICDRLADVDYSRLFCLCLSNISFINEIHIGVVAATILGVPMSTENDDWCAQEYNSAVSALCAIYDIKNRCFNNTVSVVCHGEEEIKAVLNIGDELGMHWWDTSNGLASSGIGEIAGGFDTDELHFPDKIVLDFAWDCVCYGCSNKGVDAKSFIKAYESSTQKN